MLDRDDLSAAADALADKGYGKQQPKAVFGPIDPEIMAVMRDALTVNGKPFGAPKPAAAEDDRRRFRPTPVAEFAKRQFVDDWLVRNVLFRGEPAVVCGPQKALKTNTVIDLAVSLASGLPFLGQFDVPKRNRVSPAEWRVGRADHSRDGLPGVPGERRAARPGGGPAARLLAPHNSAAGRTWTS